MHVPTRVSRYVFNLVFVEWVEIGISNVEVHIRPEYIQK